MAWRPSWRCRRLAANYRSPKSIARLPSAERAAFQDPCPDPPSGDPMIYTVENTWKELHEARVETAIVPFGAVEQHGHHLPLGTDWIIADAMGRALAEAMEEDVLLLPAMPFGNSREHMPFPGTITLRPA